MILTTQNYAAYNSKSNPSVYIGATDTITFIKFSTTPTTSSTSASSHATTSAQSMTSSGSSATSTASAAATSHPTSPTQKSASATVLSYYLVHAVSILIVFLRMMFLSTICYSRHRYSPRTSLKSAPFLFITRAELAGNARKMIVRLQRWNIGSLAARQRPTVARGD